MSLYANLQEAIDDMEALGCEEVSNSLGFQTMPEGYALMLDPDRMYFFFVSAERESAYHWNKWRIYHWAKTESRT